MPIKILNCSESPVMAGHPDGSERIAAGSELARLHLCPAHPCGFSLSDPVITPPIFLKSQSTKCIIFLMQIKQLYRVEGVYVRQPKCRGYVFEPNVDPNE